MGDFSFLPPIPYVTASPPSAPSAAYEQAKANRTNTSAVTGGRAYLVCSKTGDKMELMFFPEAITPDHVSSFGQANVPGMSHPTYQWTNGEHLLTFDISLVGDAADNSDIKAKVDWLESLTYPEYAGDTLKEGPPEVVFVFGQLYSKKKWIVKSVRPEWGNDYHPDTMIPRHCKVIITLAETVERGVDFRVVRGG